MAILIAPEFIQLNNYETEHCHSSRQLWEMSVGPGNWLEAYSLPV